MGLILTILASFSLYQVLMIALSQNSRKNFAYRPLTKFLLRQWQCLLLDAVFPAVSCIPVQNFYHTVVI